MSNLMNLHLSGARLRNKLLLNVMVNIIVINILFIFKLIFLKLATTWEDFEEKINHPSDHISSMTDPTNPE